MLALACSSNCFGKFLDVFGSVQLCSLMVGYIGDMFIVGRTIENNINRDIGKIVMQREKILAELLSVKHEA